MRNSLLNITFDSYWLLLWCGSLKIKSISIWFLANSQVESLWDCYGVRSTCLTLMLSNFRRGLFKIDEKDTNQNSDESSWASLYQIST